MRESGEPATRQRATSDERRVSRPALDAAATMPDTQGGQDIGSRARAALRARRRERWNRVFPLPFRPCPLQWTRAYAADALSNRKEAVRYPLGY